MNRPLVQLSLLSSLLLACGSALAGEVPEFRIAIKDHRFDPPEIARVIQNADRKKTDAPTWQIVRATGNGVVDR